MATPLSDRKKSADLSSKFKYLPFAENVVKISPANPEIIGLKEITLKRKKLSQAENITCGHACRAG